MSRKSFLFALASGLLSVSAMAGAAQADKFSKTTITRRWAQKSSMVVIPFQAAAIRSNRQTRSAR